MLRVLAQELVSPKSLPRVNASPTTLNHLLTLLFTVIGAIAFLMLIIAGFRYVISEGEPQKMAEIRRQIIYIAAGLILAASADLIVTFVIGKAS